MIKYLSERKGGVFLSLVFAIVGNLAMVITPFYLGLAIDAMTLDMNLVVQYLWIATGLYSLSFIFIWLSNHISFKVSVDVVSKMREDVLNKYLQLPLSVLDTTSHGSLSNLVSNDSDLILDGLFQALSQILGGVVVIVVASIFMFRISVLMTLVVFATIPLVYFSSHLVSKRSREAFTNQQTIAGELNGFVSEVIHNQQLITNYNYHGQVLEKFSELNKSYNMVGKRAQFVSSLTNPTTRVVNNLSYTVLGLVGALAILKGEISVGIFTSFISYSLMFAKPFNELSASLSQVFAARAGFESIEKILKIEDEPDGELFIESDGTVSFVDVDFSYDPKKPLIKGLDMNVSSKQKIAIVGPTGAGKSTLINILMRYYEVDRGHVYLGNVDLRDIKRESLYDNISIVLQEPWLFNGSILDNIRYGRPNASFEEVIEAAKAADCHDFIESLDDGYDTIVHDNMSAGQKQLITIARALLSSGPILILDEATSSIDSLTEKRIQTVFTQIMKQHTSFFVAHRLSTVVDSDVILVMRDGKIVEKGSHQSLMEARGFYFELYQSQF